MSSLLLRPLLRPRIAFPAIGLSLTLYHLTTQRPYRLDTPSAFSSTPGFSGYAQNAKTPVVTSKGRLNPSAVRQISLGSVTGTYLFMKRVLALVLLGVGGGSKVCYLPLPRIMCWFACEHVFEVIGVVAWFDGCGCAGM